MSQKRARGAVSIVGRDGAEVIRKPTTLEEIKSEVDRLIVSVVEAVTPTADGEGINPLAALVALEGARLTIRAQLTDALAGRPDEVARFDEQLAMLLALLRPLDASSNAPGGES